MSRLAAAHGGIHDRGCSNCADARTPGPGRFALPGAAAVWAPDRVCDVRHVRLDVTLDFERRRVDGTCTHTLAPFSDGATACVLDAVDMEIHAVTASDGAPLPCDYDGRRLRVEFGERRQGQPLAVTVRYGCAPRRGLYFIHPDAGHHRPRAEAWSHGQEGDNRHWFPCFDHPHQRSTSEVIATVPESMTVLSNGALLGETHTPGRRTRTLHYRHDVPHSAYLITLVAGEYVVLRDAFDDVEICYYVAPERRADAARSFSHTPEMMRLFSRLTGRKYPYPRYSQIAVSRFVFGGMENTSATTLSDETLHDERAHLDTSSDWLVAHELAHQWFGDLLTCRDWSQGWLNEGFATYFAAMWKEHAADGGRDEFDHDRLVDMETYLEEASHRYRRPLVTNVYHEPMDVFDAHLYEKASCVLHMLRRELGEARFWKAIGHYVRVHEGRCVETRDLVRAIEDATGWNGDRFFHQWVYSAGHPELTADLTWDEATRAMCVHVVQTQTAQDATGWFHLPLTIRFVIAGQPRDLPLVVRAREESFVYALGDRPTQAILDPGNHYLQVLDIHKPDELWREELRAAEHAIDRLRAARGLAHAGRATAVPALVAALASDAFWAVRGAAALALGELGTEEACRAIARALEAERHPKARRQIVRALGSFRHDAVAAAAATRALELDASYLVSAEAGLALARLRAPHAFELLCAAARRPSHLDVIAATCLTGLGELRDERGVAVALAAAAPDQPAASRCAAVRALGVLGAEHATHRSRIREALTEQLDDPDMRLRIAAVEALRTLGDGEVIQVLRRAEQREREPRVRRRLREAVDRLSRQAEPSEALRQLRDAMETLELANRELRDRLARLEAQLARAGSAPPVRESGGLR